MTSQMLPGCKGGADADSCMQVWPGATYYPDFLNPGVQAYWERELQDFHRLLPFDGLWIDMNEAANFCTGEVCTLPPTHNTSPASESQLSANLASGDIRCRCESVEAFCAACEV